MLTGDVRGRAGIATCLIHDISRGGACLEVGAPQRIGDRLTFARGSLCVDGVVAWVKGRRFGLRFEAPIRATELLVQMSHSRQNSPAPANPA